MDQTFEYMNYSKKRSTIIAVIILVGVFSNIPVSKAGEPPKLVLISFGGLRWDYLDDVDNLNNFKSLKSVGSYSDYVTNNFVSESLPNQWSIVTGIVLKGLYYF